MQQEPVLVYGRSHPWIGSDTEWQKANPATATGKPGVFPPISHDLRALAVSISNHEMQSTDII